MKQTSESTALLDGVFGGDVPGALNDVMRREGALALHVADPTRTPASERLPPPTFSYPLVVSPRNVETAFNPVHQDFYIFTYAAHGGVLAITHIRTFYLFILMRRE